MNRSFADHSEVQTAFEEHEELEEPYLSDNTVVKMDAETIKAYESFKNSNFKRSLSSILTAQAYKLLLFMIAAVMVLMILDTVLICFGLKSSSLLSQIFELLKYIITTLIGYLFANNLNKLN